MAAFDPFLPFVMSAASPTSSPRRLITAGSKHAGSYQHLIHQTSHIEGSDHTGQSHVAVRIRFGTLTAQGRPGHLVLYRAEASVLPAFPASAVRNEDPTKE